MASNPSISVIVPVYNAEKYMNRCLDSIVAQSFKDWECILVDDGSKDGSGVICDGYAAQDSRFRVIHKENGGVSKARQTGLDHAKGFYVIHADPDDWVEPDWLLELFNEIEDKGADMVICDFERILKNEKTLYCQKPTSLRNDDILEDLLIEKSWSCCWNKLVRRDCFQALKVGFQPEMNLWEDLYVICKLLLGGVKVAYVPKALYHYDSVSNSDSIVMHRKKEHVRSAMIFIDEISASLPQERYQEGWYFRKKIVKTWLYLLNASKDEMCDTYKEINPRLIAEGRESKPFSFFWCLALSVRGYPGLAHFLDRANLKLHRWLHL